MANELVQNENLNTNFSIKQLYGEGFDSLTSFLCPKVELAICGKKLSDDVVDGAYTIFGPNTLYSTEVAIVDKTYSDLGKDAGATYAFVSGIHHALSLGVRQIEVVYESFELIDYFRDGGLPRTTAEYGVFEFAKWISTFGVDIQYVKKRKGEYSPLIEMIGEDD